MVGENGDRLNSWKEIGAYLGKAERTVKRWEARGLPVHRLPGASGSTVYAYAGELDRWLKSVNDAAAAEAETTEPVPSVEPSTMVPTDVVSAKRNMPIRLSLALAGAALVAGAILFLSVKVDRPAAVADRSALTPAASKRHVPSPEVADLYLQGMYYWSRRTPDDLNRAVHLFNQAIAKDPNYAEAFVGLANCYNLLREYTLMPADEAYPKAKAAAERAIALDDALAEAHASLAFGEFFWFWDAAKARRSFERALQLDPHSVTTHHWLGTTLMYMGEFELALERLTEAQRLDPESRSILADKGLVLYYAGRKEESHQLLKQLTDAEPDYLAPHAYLAAIYFVEGRYDDHFRMAKQAARLMNDDDRLALADAIEKGHEAGGREGMFAALLAGQKKLYAEGKEEAYWVARTYGFLGDADKAVAYLRTAKERHEQSTLILRIDPAFRGLHANEDFRRLVREVGLPPVP